MTGAVARFAPGRAFAAQVRTEILNRTRSTGSLVALFVILIGSYWAIPRADGRAVSLSWTMPDGRIQAPLYTAGYLGIAMSVLTVMFFVLASFYLVAGAVRQDRVRGIGQILAATPITRTEYLAAKGVANALYIAVLGLLTLPVGLYHFARSGVGAFDAWQFFTPMLLVVLPAALFVSAAALLFDVTPVLRSRGGLVVWFLFGAIPMLAVPMQLSRAPGDVERFDHVPAFDPAGIAMHQALVEGSLPPGAQNISSGYVIHDQPVERVAWSGLVFPEGMLRQRAVNLLWCLVPFFAAVLLFDRFDPARGGRAAAAWRRHEAAAPAAPAAAAPESPATRTLAALARVEARPGAVAAVLAEARLLWETGGRAKWLLPPAVLAAAVAPGDAARLCGAAVLLLLVPLISEVACREDLAGARPLVYSQPGVPRSAVLWKLAATMTFLLVATAPMTLRGLVTLDARAAAVPVGMLFLSAFAVGAAALTGGGKLFSGVVLLLWYAALNGMPQADVPGLMALPGGWFARGCFLLAAGGLLAIAVWQEQRRARGV